MLGCFGARGRDAGIDRTARALLDCRKAFGEDVAEGDDAVVDVFQGAVQVHAAPTELAEVDVVAAPSVPESRGLQAKRAAGDRSPRG